MPVERVKHGWIFATPDQGKIAFGFFSAKELWWIKNTNGDEQRLIFAITHVRIENVTRISFVLLWIKFALYWRHT